MQRILTDNRWYDRETQMARVLDLIKPLPAESQEDLAVNLIKFVNIIRKNRQEVENPLSIGKNRTLGLYKAYNKRRWYDQNQTLMSAMNILSTLPVEDCKNITDGLLTALNTNEI